MTPERITDEEREVIHQEFKEGRLPGWMFKRILDSERHAWAALEEAQQQLASANVIINGHEISAERKQKFIVEQAKYVNEIAIQLREAQQTIARQRESLEQIDKACRKRSFNDCGDLRAVVYDIAYAALGGETQP